MTVQTKIKVAFETKGKLLFAHLTTESGDFVETFCDSIFSEKQLRKAVAAWFKMAGPAFVQI